MTSPIDWMDHLANLPKVGQVHLVVLAHRSGLAGAYLDEDAAHTHAKAINGVVAALPITGDYRTSGRPEVESP